MKTSNHRRCRAITTVMLLAASLTAVPALAREAPWVGETLSGRPCRDFAASGYGPFDYRDSHARANHLAIVENAHFTRKVRSLRGGENAWHPLGDLDYTLRAFPNHHAALYAIIRYATEEGFARESAKAWDTTSRSGRERAQPECYLQRALAFAPRDHRVYLLTGLYLHRKEIFDRARKAYEQAIALQPDSAETHYNFGLLLFDMGKYSDARQHARRAYEMGYPLDGLRNKLAAAGHGLND